MKTAGNEVMTEKEERSKTTTHDADPNRVRLPGEPQWPMGEDALECEDGMPVKERTEPPPPSVSLVLACAEVWAQEAPQEVLHAAYYAGRLWNAIRWLQDVWLFVNRAGEKCIELEIEALSVYLERACRRFLQKGMAEIVCGRCCDA